MAVLRTLLASLLLLTAGIGVLAALTDEFRAFTTASALRISVREQPRPVPDVALQTADGRTIDLKDLQGRWVLVDFIYTRCVSTCSVQGSEFARLQDRLAAPIARGEVSLLSISFDPAHDGPAQLAGYQRRSGTRGAGWIAARPIDNDGLQDLMRVFGIKAVADGMGGFIHNPVVAVVDPHGRLVAVLDWDDPDAAVAFVTRGSDS